MPKETIFTNAVAKLLGHKYYVNITYMRGAAVSKSGKINTYGAGPASKLFSSHSAAMRHKEQLKNNRSFGYIETVSFRSREDYECED